MVNSAVKRCVFCSIVLAAMVFSAAAADVIEPSESAVSSLQPLAFDAVGLSSLKELEPQLTGSGVRFAVICRSFTYTDGQPQNDYRPDVRANCFSRKGFDFYDSNQPEAAVSPHSTAVCSLLFGEDANAFEPNLGAFSYQGVVPDAEAGVYEFRHFLMNNVFPALPPDADIITASIGSPLEDWWTRSLESMAQRYGTLIVAGIGNGRQVYDPPLFPAASANVIGVGVVSCVNSSDFAVTLAEFAMPCPEHSTCGPTGDNRCKPDIVAPGNCLVAAANEPNRYEPSGNWSSFSTPIVAGTAGMLIQKAAEDANLSAAVSDKGGNCVIKAILMNSARKLPFWHKGALAKDDDGVVPLDYLQGAGMLDALGAYRQLVSGRSGPGDCPAAGWDLNSLRKSETFENTYRLEVAEPNDSFITVTIVWNKHYEPAYPFRALPEKDGDLLLELWAVEPNEPDSGYLLDYSNSATDNVEHIYCRADPNYSNYEIVIAAGEAVSSDKPLSQPYGLAWNVSARRSNNDSVFLYDLNTDGIVDRMDFGILVENLLKNAEKSRDYIFGDINGDGSVDIDDVQLLVENTGLKTDWYHH